VRKSNLGRGGASPHLGRSLSSTKEEPLIPVSIIIHKYEVTGGGMRPWAPARFLKRVGKKGVFYLAPPYF